ncbi:MAG TPA: 16S rRNA (cytidine(1402)-2'-O)-methyltransferase [Anaerolineae bacterium]|nr:16S rRNA (cytidine(1402)-2'-O)-methyltransferase [Anaerolineae bacterium]
MGTLSLVGTPIGNLEDISPRALGVLREVTLIASENPLRTLRLLARYDLHTRMMRYTDAYERKKQERMRAVLAALAEGDVALVSEAGMPGLADPGYELVAAALQRGIEVVPVPGPAALTAALSVAGIECERFTFVGFVPREGSARRALLALLEESPFAIVAYEAPHRLADTLADVAHLFGDRPVAVACELTKLFEQVRRGTAAELAAHYHQEQPRGEFTIVIGAATSLPPAGAGGD